MASDLMGTLHKAMSGLQAFTRGLDNLSNNVANLNTFGYKANDLFYKELQGNPSHDVNGEEQKGQGVEVGGSSIRFVQGDLFNTGRNTDVAISGNGFFVLRNEHGEEHYSRSGNFTLDDAGFLVSLNDGLKVAKVDSNGRLADINLREKIASPAVATTRFGLSGVLNESAFEGDQFPPASSTERIEVGLIDKNGATQTVFVKFTKASERQWSVELVDAEGEALTEMEQIDFGEAGAPTGESALKTFTFTDFTIVSPEDGGKLFDVKNFSAEDADPQAGDSDGWSDFLTLSLTPTRGELILRAEGEPARLADQAELQLDDTGYLVEVDTADRLAARGLDGELIDAKIVLTSPSEATSSIEISGSIPLHLAVEERFPPAVVVDSDATPPLMVKIYDAQGNVEEMAITLVRTAAEENTRSYEVILVTDSDTAIKANAELTFQWLPDNKLGRHEGTDTRNIDRLGSDSSFTDDVSRTDGRWVINPGKILFNLGSEEAEREIELAASDSLTLIQNSEAKLSVVKIDGRESGILQGLEVNEDGQLRATYTNGDASDGPMLAVAERAFTNMEVDFSAVSSARFVTSEVAVEQINGRATGQLTDFVIEADGTILLSYSNGDSVEDGNLALALFNNTQDLVREGSSLFLLKEGGVRVLGSGLEGAFGQIIHKSLERSNVELSKEFSEIIIVQRGFQASSQVLNATNELIEELYNSTRGGRR